MTDTTRDVVPASSQPSGWLQSVDSARAVLEQIERVEDAADLIDQAEVAKVYARNVLRSREAQNHAAHVALMCQRKAGELLSAATIQGRPKKGNTSLPFLSELGVSKMQSSRWQKVAKVPDEVLEHYVEHVEATEDEITTAGLVRYYKDTQTQQRKTTHRQEEEEARTNGTEKLDVRRGRFQDVLADLEDGSVDLIVTDPPYGPKYNDAYADLARFAATKLKPGGSCIAYAGQSNLPDVLTLMSEHLRYWWTLSLVHKHGGQQLPGKWVMVEWKPVVWFVNGHRADRTYVADRMSGSKPRKELHEWAQGVDEVAYLIEHLTRPGHLVVDPFAGSGSFGYAAQSMGRRFIGAESGEHKDAA